MDPSGLESELHRSALWLALFTTALAGCGDLVDGDLVVADPAYFANQRFACDPRTGIRECPPFACQVDQNGSVVDCDQGCDVKNNVTAFELQAPTGFDLCVPRRCTVPGENQAPECEPGCSDDDTTLYVFLFEC